MDRPSLNRKGLRLWPTHNTLRFIGILYGAMTAIVGLIAVIVVSSHVVGAMTLDDTRTASIEISSVHR